MRLFDEAASFATPENAEKKLDRVLATVQMTRDDVRWCIVINSRGRYVPALQVGSKGHLVQLAHDGICVF